MSKESKKGFVLYYDYRNHLALLSDEERGQLLMELFDYSESGKESNLKGAALMAFSFIQAQMDRDMAKYAETVRKRREAGMQGGRPPKATESNENQNEAKKANGFLKKQTKAKKPDTVTDTDTDTDTDTYIPPIPPSGESRTDAKTERFSIFWSEYPKKVGKKAALTAWNRLKPDSALFERIMQAVSNAKKSEQWIREGGRFIPNPATWINQGRWDDELPPPEAGKQPERKGSFDTGEFMEAAVLRSWNEKAKNPPKTAATDEAIQKRAEILRAQLG